MKRQRMEQMKAGLSAWLDLPEDVLRDLPAVHLIGSQQMRVENHRGLIEYTPKAVKVNTSSGLMTVAGRELLVQTIGSEDIIIRGEILSFSYKK